MSVEYINLGEYFYIMNRIAWWIIKNNKKFNTRNIYGYFGRDADYGTIIKVINERKDNVELDGLIAEFVECAIVDNKDLSFLPAYVTCSDGKTQIKKDEFIDMANRVSAYEVQNGKSPNIVYIKNNNTETTQKSRYVQVLEKFEKHFGQTEYIDDALAKIQNKGYVFYFSDGFNMYNTIERVANGDGANCYDISEVLYYISKGMNEKYGRNYEPEYLDVWCPVSGYDHIRLRFWTENGYFYRDGACVLDGGAISSNWCGTSNNILEVNPSWIYDGD